jgi:hypothetical protein
MAITWSEVVAVVGGAITVGAWLQTLARTGRAVGTIIKIETRSGPDGDATSVPLIEFRVKGTKYSFQPGLVLPGESKKKSIGRKVNVAYNPSDPNDAEVASAVRLYLGPLIVTALYAAYTYWYWTHGG